MDLYAVYYRNLTEFFPEAVVADYLAGISYPVVRECHENGTLDDFDIRDLAQSLSLRDLEYEVADHPPIRREREDAGGDTLSVISWALRYSAGRAFDND